VFPSNNYPKISQASLTASIPPLASSTLTKNSLCSYSLAMAASAKNYFVFSMASASSTISLSKVAFMT
jgi:hypothetical protein